MVARRMPTTAELQRTAEEAELVFLRSKGAEEQAYWAWLKETRRYVAGTASYKTHTLKVRMLSAWRAGALYGCGKYEPIVQAVAKAPCLCRNAEKGQTCLGCDAKAVLGLPLPDEEDKHE